MDQETEITSIKNFGNSPVVLTGPHNGYVVPDTFKKNGKILGVEPYWFDPDNPAHRHEVCDWGMQELFNIIETKSPDITLVAAKISRLVVDLNRIPSVMIYESSSETGESIPGNMHLNDDKKTEREHMYFRPFHDTVNELMIAIREKFGRVIWIDMHSFTPIWKDQPRAVGIGSLKLDRTPFNANIERWLEHEFGELFVPDEPYDMRISPFREISGGPLIADHCDIEYFGLEIRNDLLSTPVQLDTMAEKIIRLAKHLTQ